MHRHTWRSALCAAPPARHAPQAGVSQSWLPGVCHVLECALKPESCLPLSPGAEMKPYTPNPDGNADAGGRRRGRHAAAGPASPACGPCIHPRRRVGAHDCQGTAPLAAVRRTNSPICVAASGFQPWQSDSGGMGRGVWPCHCTAAARFSSAWLPQILFHSPRHFM